MNGTPLSIARGLLTAGFVCCAVACGGDDPAPASVPSVPVPDPEAPVAEVAPTVESPAATSDPLRQRIVLESTSGCALSQGSEPGSVWCWSGSAGPTRVANVGPFIDLAVSLFGRCGRTEEGAIQCWSASGAPLPAPTGVGYTDVAVSWVGACGVRAGHVICASSTGTDENAGGLTDAVELAAAASTMCARRTDGSVSCFAFGAAAQPRVGLTGVTRIAGDGALGCALRAEGTVSCWGGEPRAFVEGAPPATPSFDVAGITGATELAVGGNGVCAKVGEAWLCAGSDVAGRFGQGTTGVRRAAVPAASFGSDPVALAEDASCVLHGNEVRCLGSGRLGALGPSSGSMAVNEVLRPASDGERASDLWVFGDAACARIGDHLRCWGSAEWDDPTLGLLERARHRRIGPTPLGLHGRLPDIARAYEVMFTRCSLSTTAELRCHDEPDLRRADIATVASGDAGICFLGMSGAIECPPMETGITLFDGAEAGGEPSGAISVAVGSTFACAAFSDDPVRCAISREADELLWFDVEEEEVDEGSDEDWNEEPVSLPAPEWRATEARALELVAGLGMVCGRTSEGTAWCSGGAVDLERPRTLRRFVDAGAVSLVGGDEFACALVQIEGQPDAVRCFGYRAEILGAEPSTDDGWDATSIGGLLAGMAAAPAPAPEVTAPATAPTTAPAPATSGETVPVAAPHWGIVEIGAGREHACALRSDGAVFCWGVDSLGQVGRTPSTLHLTPVSLPLGS